MTLFAVLGMCGLVTYAGLDRLRAWWQNPTPPQAASAAQEEDIKPTPDAVATLATDLTPRVEALEAKVGELREQLAAGLSDDEAFGKRLREALDAAGPAAVGQLTKGGQQVFFDETDEGTDTFTDANGECWECTEDGRRRPNRCIFHGDWAYCDDGESQILKRRRCKPQPPKDADPCCKPATVKPIETPWPSPTVQESPTPPTSGEVCLKDWPTTREEAPRLIPGTFPENWEPTGNGGWHHREVIGGAAVPPFDCLTEGFWDIASAPMVWAAYTSLSASELRDLMSRTVGNRTNQASWGLTVWNTRSTQLAKDVHCSQWEDIQRRFSPEERRHWALHAIGFVPRACVPFPSTAAEAAELLGQPGTRSGSAANWEPLTNGGWHMKEGVPRAPFYVHSWLQGEGWVDPQSLPLRPGYWAADVLGGTIYPR